MSEKRSNPMWYALAGIVVAATLFVVVFGGYQLGWWLREDAVNRQAEVFNDSFQRQSAVTNEIVDKVAEIRDIDVLIVDPDLTAAQKGALNAQRSAITDQVCALDAQRTGNVTLSGDAAEFVAGEC